MRAIRRAIGLPPAAFRPKRLLISQDTPDLKAADGRMLKSLEKPIPIELMDKVELGNDSFIYRFALPGRDSVLGHLTCQYLQLEADVKVGEGKT